MAVDTKRRNRNKQRRVLFERPLEPVERGIVFPQANVNPSDKGSLYIRPLTLGNELVQDCLGCLALARKAKRKGQGGSEKRTTSGGLHTLREGCNSLCESPRVNQRVAEAHVCGREARVEFQCLLELFNGLSEGVLSLVGI